MFLLSLLEFLYEYYISKSTELSHFCNEIPVCGLIREFVSLEGDNLLVFYCIIAFEIWPDNRVGVAFKEGDYCNMKY